MKQIAQRPRSKDRARCRAISLLILFCLLVGDTVGAVAARPSSLRQHPSTPPDETEPDANDARLQKVAVERYGVTVNVPEGWRLVLTGREDRAFVLLLPQGEASRPAVAACEIAVAPQRLEDFQSRIDRNAEDLSPERNLVRNRIVSSEEDDEPDAAQPKLLESLWELSPPDGSKWFDLKVRRIENNQLYTFILIADQDHFEAYQQEFRAAIAKAAFSAPDTGLQPLPGGYWMHATMHFGLKLPEGWKPSFPLSERAPFFATGPAHEVLADNLIVVPTTPEKLDLDRLIERFPDEIKKLDPGAKVLRSDKVPQGDGEAVETVIETRRGPFRVTILQRRFQGKRRNYEINFTILTDEFEKLEPQLKASADSFKEFPTPPRQDAA